MYVGKNANTNSKTATAVQLCLAPASWSSFAWSRSPSWGVESFQQSTSTHKATQTKGVMATHTLWRFSLFSFDSPMFHPFLLLFYYAPVTPCSTNYHSLRGSGINCFETCVFVELDLPRQRATFLFLEPIRQGTAFCLGLPQQSRWLSASFSVSFSASFGAKESMQQKWLLIACDWEESQNLTLACNKSITLEMAKTDDPSCSCLLTKMQFFPSWNKMVPKSWSSSKENLSRRFHVNTGLLGRSGDFLPRGNFCRTSKYPLLVSYLSRRVGFQLFLLYRGSTFSISHCVRVSYMRSSVKFFRYFGQFFMSENENF